MPELSPIEKAQFETELREHVIACVVDPDCPSPTLARSIMRSIDSRKEHYGGGHIDTIYKEQFNRSASKVYEYIVSNYGYLLDEQGIDYDDQSEAENEAKAEPAPASPTPSPAPSVQAGPDWITWALMGGAVLTGIYWIKNR